MQSHTCLSSFPPSAPLLSWRIGGRVVSPDSMQGAVRQVVEKSSSPIKSLPLTSGAGRRGHQLSSTLTEIDIMSR